ncbi:hypothetical protein BBJ28_00016609 [Nothophytophthora sp. Chile5]|nr:hypothetical protein BBJ28_00016609 [Nothophytophthora sp. Chile5]
MDSAETGSFISARTTRSVTSSLHSATRSSVGFELKRPRYQAAIAEDFARDDEGMTADKFKLKTLEEHRFATRFQEKRVTPKTWRSALREAHQLVRSGDRIHLAEALYLLLEIIWLAPQRCNLATLCLDVGSIYLVFDHLEEAAKQYRNSLRLNPSNWKARYNLGVTAARLEDFVESTRQLNLALKTCPPDIAQEIHPILEEIDLIQCAKNLRAFQESDKARAFTVQYLESVHLVVGKETLLGPSALPEDHTLCYRNGSALVSLAPQLSDHSSDWQGPLASLLHRLYTFAGCHHVQVHEEMLRIDPARTGGISVEALDKLVKRTTGSALRSMEREELSRLFGDG